jgi:ABC-type sugar transport system ATPase subunit
MGSISVAKDAEKSSRHCCLRGIGLSKSFGHVQALMNVDVQIYAGEVLALVGDNGAGKSTLIKILCGVYQADEGHIEVNGQKVNISKPHDAIALGIATVFQDLALIDSRDVSSNVFLGYEPTRLRFFIDKARMNQMAQTVLSQLRADIPSPSEEVGTMSGGQRQAIAIARALTHKSQILILDEPTAALGIKESQQVLNVIHRLRDEGIGIVVISHNLLHVWEIADYIMVLNRGQKVGVKKKKDTSPEDIVKMIVGVDMLSKNAKDNRGPLE